MPKIIRTAIFMLVFVAFGVHAATYNGPIPQGSKWVELRSYIDALKAERARAKASRRQRQ